MKKDILVAVTAAVEAYLQMEEAQKFVSSPVTPLPFSPWKLFGRQEQLRLRVSIQQRYRRS